MYQSSIVTISEAPMVGIIAGIVQTQANQCHQFETTQVRRPFKEFFFRAVKNIEYNFVFVTSRKREKYFVLFNLRVSVSQLT